MIERLEANWQAIVVELDAPRAGRLERTLRRVGVPGWAARLVVGTPALRRGWLVASAIVLFFGVSAANNTDGRSPHEALFTFLLVAPLVPLAGVALAYGPGSDPAYEVSVSTPDGGLRLLLVRTAVVLTVSLPLETLVAAALPVGGPIAMGWLLPALGLCGLTLALASRISARAAAASVATAWVLVVVVVSRSASDQLLPFRVGGQLAMLLMGAGCVVAALAQRDRFETLGRVHE